MQQLVAHLHRDRVAFLDRETRPATATLTSASMRWPSQRTRVSVTSTTPGVVLERLVDLVDDLRVDAVDGAAEDALADCQTMRMMARAMSSPTIGSASGKPEPDADRAGEHREAGEAVDAGVLPVGDEGDAADAPTGADAELGDGLVAEEADEGGDGHRAEIA